MAWHAGVPIPHDKNKKARGDYGSPIPCTSPKQVPSMTKKNNDLESIRNGMAMLRAFLREQETTIDRIERKRQAVEGSRHKEFYLHSSCFEGGVVIGLPEEDE